MSGSITARTVSPNPTTANPSGRRSAATRSAVACQPAESAAKAGRRPYHRRKLALVLANLRHFALEQAARGVAVRHVATAGGYAEGLREVLGETGPIPLAPFAEFRLVWNYGISYGMFQQDNPWGRWVLVGLATVAAGAVVYKLFLAPKAEPAVPAKA